MSGRKHLYVSVEARELQRLQNNEYRLRNLSAELQNRVNEIRNQCQRDIKQQDKNFTTMIEQENRNREAAVDGLQQQINAIVSDTRRKQEIARAFMVDLTQLLRETDELPHQRFAPAEMPKIRRHVEDAMNNIDANMSDAALSTAQNAYWKVNDLRVFVLEKQREFNKIYLQALQDCRELLETARLNRKRQLDLGVNGQWDSIEMEVDYWTSGELSAFEKEVKSLDERLKKNEANLTIDQVNEILNSIDVLKPQPLEIVDHARQNILASHLRFEIAEMVSAALNHQGFTVQDSIYEQDDERNAYIIKLKNIAGSEVVTLISPVANEYGKNSVTINSYDETYIDPTILLQRSQQISSALKEFEGLNIGELEHLGHAMPEYRDLINLKQRKTSPVQTKTRSSR